MASCHHTSTHKAPIPVTLARAMFAWKRHWENTPLVRTCDNPNGVSVSVDAHAYRLAFVHEELVDVFRTRQRVETYGKHTLPQGMFRERQPKLTTLYLKITLCRINLGSFTIGHPTHDKRYNGPFMIALSLRVSVCVVTNKLFGN